MASFVSFGRYLRQYREQAGWSHALLAERAGLPAELIAALEQGEQRRPYPQLVRALADALDLHDEARQALFAAAERAALPFERPELHQQLPAHLSSLVGRAHEIATLVGMLGRPELRLLTLVGPGGVGKTRLAIEVARDCAHEFADGAIFVALAPLASADLVLTTVVRTLGLPEGGGFPPAQVLAQWLRQREMLLVLDNLEHVLDAALQIGEMLRACPRLKVLATSREALQLQGEQVYPVPPLAFPRSEQLSTLDDVLRYDAVRLFVQRAQAVRPTLLFSQADGRTIAELCARLDGLPLAIELAAARMTVLSPMALLMRLEQQLLTLQSGARDLPARQQTMRATIAWSYELLNADEQQLFRCLAIFAGGATLAAIRTVCGKSSSESEALRLIASLVHKHLVQPVQHDDEPRFEMLETIRSYGLEQLHLSDQDGAIAEQHARYMLDLAESAAPHLMGPDQARWFRRLDAEQHNLRSAVRWCFDHAAWQEAVRLVWALWRFWWVRGLHREARQWMEYVLTEALALTPLHHAQAELTVFSMAWAAGAIKESWQIGQRSLHHSPAHNDRRVEAISLMMIGATLISSGTYAEAETHLLHSIELFEAINEPWGAAFAMANIGFVWLHRAGSEQALNAFETALTLARRSGDLTITHQVLYFIALAAQVRGETARTVQALHEGLKLCLSLEDRVNIGYFVKGIATLAALHLDTPRGMRLLGAAAALMESVGVPFHRDAPSALWHANVIERLQATHDPAELERLYTEGRSMQFGQAQAEAEALGAALSKARLAPQPLQALAAERAAGTAAHFAQSKLQPPRAHADTLVRTRLTDQLSQAIGQTKLLLVSAPAGSGKTTLLSSVLAVTSARSAWVALDADDNDLFRFIGLLSAAIERLLPPGSQALPTIRSASAENTIAPLIERLLASNLEPALLVLDDLHLLDGQPIFNALTQLIEQSPPELTIVIATRHDPPLPLARWRARRALRELRLPELRFTEAEAMALLNKQLGLGLDEQQVAAFYQRTEGWASGLTLLAASLEQLREPEQRAQFLARLAQVDRHIFEYLAEEVLNQQDPFVRSFLLETSTLLELTPAACQAISGRADAAAILDDLYRRNLFLIALGPRAASPDAQTPTYRYHELFRDFLQSRLREAAPEWWQALHRLAAAAESDPTRTVQYLLRGELWSAAVPAIEQAAARLARHGTNELVQGWLAQLPADILAAHPHLTQWDVPQKGAVPGEGTSGLYIPATGETLTAREVEVLRLLVRGASNAQIAARLVISSHTAKHHVSRVLAKLGAASRSEASAKGRDLLP
jgi:predicted ATPase/DNA-binding NarL/FixJ family response regulator/transcriptional regulator with XRE-family HTH domain/energy-coupling factor transporter ATP-binding protein EcfA2